MKFQLSSEYGELSPIRDFRPHNGIDLAMSDNTTLRAIGEGVVDKVFDGTGLIGKGLSIQFPDGTRAIYGHMNEVNVKVGQHVNVGDTLGLSGSTGHSTGGHLHFGMKDPAGNWMDPTPLAEKLAGISGEHVDPGIITALLNNPSTQGPLARLLWGSTEGIREWTADAATEIALGLLDALKDLLLGTTLIGSGVLILLKVAGWRDGGRWAGLLLVANILIKFLFGVN